AAGVGSDVLHGSRLGSRGGHDNGVFECAVLFELANDVGNGRSLLADSNVDAGDTLALLGNDGVDGDGGLTGLAVANDQLALTTTHRDHGVDGLGTSLQRLRHRLTGNHARSNLLDNIGQLGIDRTLAVNGATQRIDHAAAQLGADRHFENAAGRLDRVAFRHAGVITQHHGADGVALEVQRQAEDVVGEFEHFALHHIGQTVDAANTVGHGNDRTLCANISRRTQTFDAGLEQFTDLRRVKLHVQTPESCYLAFVRRPAYRACGPIGPAPKCQVPGRPRPLAHRRSVRNPR